MFFDTNHDVLLGGYLPEASRCSLNRNPDDRYCSFNVLAMAFSEASNLLAVMTDSKAILIVRPFQSSPVQSLFGVDVDMYDKPSLAFSQKGGMVYASSGGEIMVWETKTGKRVTSIPGTNKINATRVLFGAFFVSLVVCV